jgi:hypothetical protein
MTFVLADFPHCHTIPLLPIKPFHVSLTGSVFCECPDLSDIEEILHDTFVLEMPFCLLVGAASWWDR